MEKVRLKGGQEGWIHPFISNQTPDAGIHDIRFVYLWAEPSLWGPQACTLLHWLTRKAIARQIM